MPKGVYARKSRDPKIFNHGLVGYDNHGCRCSDCVAAKKAYYTSNSRLSRTRDQMVTLGVRQNKHLCPACMSEFKNETLYKEHYREKHTYHAKR